MERKGKGLHFEGFFVFGGKLIFGGELGDRFGS